MTCPTPYLQNCTSLLVVQSSTGSKSCVYQPNHGFGGAQHRSFSLLLLAMGLIPSNDNKRRRFSDQCVCSYTPTLSALIASRTRAAQVSNRSPSLLAGRGFQRCQGGVGGNTSCPDPGHRPRVRGSDTSHGDPRSSEASACPFRVPRDIVNGKTIRRRIGTA